MAFDNLQKERLKKLNNIKRLGVNPYPSKSERKQTIIEALKMMGKKVTVAGRIRSIRPHGKISFMDIEDATGRMQLLFRQDNLPGEKYEFLPNFDIGDFIDAAGEVIKTQAGQVTVDISNFKLLTKSLRPIPSDWYGLKDKEERLRKRYLDLIINPEIKDLFLLKTKFWASVRNYLIKQGGIEVETPVLQSIPGGGDARPFITHHHAQNIKLYLRISPELYLKRLLVGGFEKVFEIGRIFRNEGIDDEHLQDYTQMEMYWAYMDYQQLMNFVEDMTKTVIKETFGTLKTTWKGHTIDWSKKWPRIDYMRLLSDHWEVDADILSVEDLYKLSEKLNVKVEPNLGRGRLFDYLYKKTIRPKLIQPQFLINHPVEVEPLAKRTPKDSGKVERMQILAMGSELGKGFSELNDPIDQNNRFKEQMELRKKGDEEAQMMDKDFVEALEYGMPPAAGFAYSERLFAMLVDKPIREMVFFPTMKPEKKRSKK